MPDAVPVLLLSTGTRGYGTARAPRSLARAGFDVTLLTPRGTLAESSRFVSRVAHLPERVTQLEWIHAVAATVRAIAPALVIPCDDMSFRLLATLAIAPPPQMQAALQQSLASLVRESLGDPSHYLRTIDRTLLPDAAIAAGVPVPNHAVVGALEGAVAFAARHGYRVVLKRAMPGGDAVRVADDEPTVATAFRALTPQAAADDDVPAGRLLLVQQRIDGALIRQSVAAWRGRYLAGYATERLAEPTAPAAPASVVRHVHSLPLRDMAARLVEAFGITGLVEVEFVIDPSTQTPLLIGINRRIGRCMHVGTTINVDLGAALRAAMADEPSASRSRLDDAEARTSVQFPAEWLRDPGSPWLRKHPVDVPWDDPELFDAMLALRAAG
ncbi:MAG: hypothetical protein ABI533_08610 [Betaproteobacteria bacterium]